MDERPPPLRLVYADELGQIKGACSAGSAMLLILMLHAQGLGWELLAAADVLSSLPAVVQTADGAQPRTAAVADTW